MELHEMFGNRELLLNGVNYCNLDNKKINETIHKCLDKFDDDIEDIIDDKEKED